MWSPCLFSSVCLVGLLVAETSWKSINSITWGFNKERNRKKKLSYYLPLYPLSFVQSFLTWLYQHPAGMLTCASFSVFEDTKVGLLATKLPMILPSPSWLPTISHLVIGHLTSTFILLCEYEILLWPNSSH